MKTICSFLCFFVLACGADDGGEKDDGFECDRTTRDGTYLIMYETLSGTCGEMPDTVVQLDGGNEGVGGGCVLNHEEWSEDDCALERDITCTVPEDNLTINIVGQTTQETSSGSALTGVMTMTLRYLDTSALACSGTYETVAVRQ